MQDNDRLDAAALSSAAREAEEAAMSVSRAFERTGDDIARAMERAARSGSLSIHSMVEEVLQSLARIALDRLIINPLGQMLGQQIAGITGQRAEGGPVLAGQSYLVGERGPEMFTPMANGAVIPGGRVPVINIAIHASGDAASAVRRSESQIAASLARAVRAGSERL
ncbi:MAG: gene transfer agent tail tape measure protein [Oceanicaulis sp. HLUCCA04]|nr:MAG: gene transfer agent tail tape measure protein [Oceanicaulis sp. HLUCCA04]